MRKLAISLMLIVCVAAVVLWLGSSDDPATTGAAQRAGEASEPVAAAPSVAPEKMNAILSQPVRAQRGAGTIRGQVKSKGEPVVGATVTATRAESDDSLSELDCQCGNVCGRKLLECGCGEASEQLKTLVSERRGEVVPIGRTTSGADGSFELTGLDPGEVALWADSSTLGTSLKQHVRVGADQVGLELGAGLALKGKVTIDGAPAPANAWVTAIHGEQSRFFDVLTQADGAFTIGPLPIGLYSLVAGAPGALAGHQHLRKDSPIEGFEISLYTPRTIAGRVELDGEPVGGVAVKLKGNHRESDAVSAADGFFRFTELRPGDHQLTALKGTLRADVTVDIEKKGNPKPAVLRLVESARFVGTVRSAEGPVGNAKLKLYSLGQEAETKSGADGRFELSSFPGKGMNLEVKADGFVEHKQDLDLTAGEETKTEIVLQPETAISGTVVDEEGAPVVAADIAAVRARKSGADDEEAPTDFEDYSAWKRRRDREEPVWAKSDDAGMFVVKKIAAGDYRVIASHREYRRAETTAHAPAAQVRLQLTNGVALTGQVVNEAGKPVAAKVRAWIDDDRTPQAAHEATAGVDGSFRIQGLTEGQHQVRAEAPNAAVAKEVVLAAREENHVRLVLESLLSIAGTVVDTEGKPVPMIMVSARTMENAHGGMATSKSDGAFEIDELKVGDYRLEVYAPKHAPLSTEGMRVKAGVKDVKLVLKARLIARGRVVDPKGKPVPEFVINFQKFAEAGGTFEVALSGRPEEKLRIGSPGFLEVTKKLRVEGRDVEVGDIVIGGREVRVRAIVASTGQPLEGADVWTDTAFAAIRAAPPALTGKDGWATLRGIPLSNAVVVVNHPKYRPTHVPLSDVDSERVVPMDPGATLVVKVVDPDGAPVRATVVAQTTDRIGPTSLETDKAGVLRMEGMPSGKWTISASGTTARFNESFKAQKVVELPETGEVPLTLKLATGAIALELTFALPPGDWAGARLIVLPSGAPAPTAGRELISTAALAAEGTRGSKPGQFTVRGIYPGRQVAVVFLHSLAASRAVFFTVPLEVSAEPKQTFTFPAPPASALIELGFDE